MVRGPKDTLSPDRGHEQATRGKRDRSVLLPEMLIQIARCDRVTVFGAIDRLVPKGGNVRQHRDGSLSKRRISQQNKKILV
ncbi:MAG: hypothetical protein M1826_000613 [Phylliscum demangeonii]|nr:MAG: hypothetical protein M1826_000613 [Phylliscum demangeonii]